MLGIPVNIYVYVFCICIHVYAYMHIYVYACMNTHLERPPRLIQIIIISNLDPHELTYAVGPGDQVVHLALGELAAEGIGHVFDDTDCAGVRGVGGGERASHHCNG